MKQFLSFLAVFLIFCFGMVQIASADNIALSLVIDGSGSISDDNWNLQLDAYQNALLSTVPLDGTVALNLIQFSNDAKREIKFKIINTQQDLIDFNLLVDAVEQKKKKTNISEGIRFARSTLLLFDLTHEGDWEWIIDVSTDGYYNLGDDPQIAAETAISAGTSQVNAIGIGIETAPDFNRGTGSFSLLADSFADFESTLKDKLEREFDGTPDTPVPEPATIVLFGFGLLGLAGVNRRKNGFKNQNHQ